MQITESYIDECVDIVLHAGQRVRLVIEDAGSWIVVDHGEDALLVLTDVPDPSGRGGVDDGGLATPIYEEVWADFEKKAG